jgi:hypothetical protein
MPKKKIDGTIALNRGSEFFGLPGPLIAAAIDGPVGIDLDSREPQQGN